MSGRFMRLKPGRYTLAVSQGEGPAGVERGEKGVRLSVEGGRADFQVPEEERVFYWWRGPRERSGVRLFGVSDGRGTSDPSDAWPTGTTG